jgi:hypothetical protein
MSPRSQLLKVVVALSVFVQRGEAASAPTARGRALTKRRIMSLPDDALSPEIDIHEDTPPGVVLMLPGKRFPLNFAGGELTMHDIPILVSEVPNTGAGTGLTIWDGSVVLAKYLEHARLPLDGKHVVEVGAGTGLVGICASVLGAERVTLTDLEYTLNNTRKNVVENAASLRGAVETVELDWFAPGANASTAAAVRRPDWILGADVVWVDSLIAPLVNTLRFLTEAAAAPEGAAECTAAGQCAATTAECVRGAAGVVGMSPHGGCGSSSCHLTIDNISEISRKASSGPAARSVDQACGSTQCPSAKPSDTAGGGSAADSLKDEARDTTILIAHQTRARSSDALFFQLLAEAGFEWEAIPHVEQHPRFRDPDINIFRIRRRPTPATQKAAPMPAPVGTGAE